MKTTMFNIDTLIRENVRRMKPYSSARDEFKGDASIFLDANENPFPSYYNRYPDPVQQELKRKLATKKNVNSENIFLGNGSDEAIDLLIRAFCEPRKDEILIVEPTYGMYRVCAELNDVAVKSITFSKEFALSSESVMENVSPNTKLIFLCSPNNPTGNQLDKGEIIQILSDFNGIVVVDEAYIDFANSESLIAELMDFQNLVVLQTFSKAWGLAALRLGVAYASKRIIEVLSKIKYPYNVNEYTQQVAIRALDNEDKVEEQITEIKSQRSVLEKQLNSLSIVTQVYPSDANFILVKFTNANLVYEQLSKYGIVVRNRSHVIMCENCLRITVGTKEENESLIQALKAL